MTATDAPRCYALVPCAGIGARSGAGVPKQYATIAGRAMVAHTLAALAGVARIVGTIVVLAPGDDRFETSAPQFAGATRWAVRCGGATRARSVANGLGELLERGARPGDWVLVHDAARPCVRHADIDHLLQRGMMHDTGALLAAPVRDTIKRGNAEHEAEASVPRENLWRAFTPQLFHRGELADALEAAIASGVAATDEAKALELRGKTALLVTGSDDNLKVTSAEDLAIAEMILRRQEDEA